MKKHTTKSLLIIFLLYTIVLTTIQTNAQFDKPSYLDLRKNFVSPDYSYWGKAPLWWWEADSLDKERISWQLEALSAKGMKAVCPIQRSPGQCYPESFSTAWWETLTYVHKECERLGIPVRIC